MRNRYRWTVALCTIGSVYAGPGRAQDINITSPDVRVETHVLDRQDAGVETSENSSRMRRILQQLEVPVLNEKLVAELQADTGALQQYTLGQTYQSMAATLYSPAMAKKTRDIALLRQIVALELSARDIEKALPLLRELKDSGRVAPVKPEQALDEEYNRLLRAKPGDPMPPSSASALRDAIGGSRTRKQAIWDKMAEQIGRKKAAGLRALVRSEGIPVLSSIPIIQNLFTMPDAPTPPLSGQYRSKPAGGKLRNNTPPADAAAPDPLVPAKPDDDEPGDRPAARPRLAQPAQDPTASSDDAAPAAPGANRRQSRAVTRSSSRSQSTAPTAPPASVLVTPGAHSMAIDNSGNHVRVWSVYGQATLDELIDLLEKKLAAMR